MIKFRNLEANEIEVRVGQKFKNGKMSLLCYQDSRCAMRILDETVGNENWSCNYSRQGNTLFCSIGIFVREHNAFIYKSDAGTETNFEAVKGEASDSFKRAAVRWGIGRALYTCPKVIIPESEATFYVSDIQYDENDNVRTLIICDWNDNIVFNYVNGKICKNTVPDVDPEEILSTVCGDLKNAGEDYKELGRFYKYYKDKIVEWSNVNEKMIRKLWDKWGKK